MDYVIIRVSIIVMKTTSMYPLSATGEIVDLLHTLAPYELLKNYACKRN